MHTLKNITTTLIITLLLSFTGFASATIDVNLKTASGVEKLVDGGYQQKSVFKLLFHQGKLDFSTDDASGSPIATKSAGNIKYIGKVDDLKNIPRNQTLLDDLPDLGSPRANWKQNSSVLRKAQRDGYEIRDASAHRRNYQADPTRERPSRKIGQSFLGAERNLLNNRGGSFDASRSNPRRLP